MTVKGSMVMHRFVFSIAAVLLFIPSMADANCGDGACSVGALGTGGVSSDGKAQGFYDKFPSTRFPGSTFTNSGNLDAGRLNITGGVGTTSGTFRQDSVRGRSSGTFGDWTGQCPIEDFPCDDTP